MPLIYDLLSIPAVFQSEWQLYNSIENLTSIIKNTTSNISINIVTIGMVTSGK